MENQYVTDSQFLVFQTAVYDEQNVTNSFKNYI